jgi:hypothetical protein
MVIIKNTPFLIDKGQKEMRPRNKKRNGAMEQWRALYP